MSATKSWSKLPTVRICRLSGTHFVCSCCRTRTRRRSNKYFFTNAKNNNRTVFESFIFFHIFCLVSAAASSNANSKRSRRSLDRQTRYATAAASRTFAVAAASVADDSQVAAAPSPFIAADSPTKSVASARSAVRAVGVVEARKISASVGDARH